MTVQVLQDFVLSFIACFILLVIAPLNTQRLSRTPGAWDCNRGHLYRWGSHLTRGRQICPVTKCVVSFFKLYWCRRHLETSASVLALRSFVPLVWSSCRHFIVSVCPFVRHFSSMMSSRLTSFFPLITRGLALYRERFPYAQSWCYSS